MLVVEDEFAGFTKLPDSCRNSYRHRKKPLLQSNRRTKREGKVLCLGPIVVMLLENKEPERRLIIGFAEQRSSGIVRSHRRRRRWATRGDRQIWTTMLPNKIKGSRFAEIRGTGLGSFIVAPRQICCKKPRKEGRQICKSQG